jgi:hypothetical protein
VPPLPLPPIRDGDVALVMEGGEFRCVLLDLLHSGDGWSNSPCEGDEQLRADRTRFNCTGQVWQRGNARVLISLMHPATETCDVWSLSGTLKYDRDWGGISLFHFSVFMVISFQACLATKRCVFPAFCAFGAELKQEPLVNPEIKW